MADQGRVGAITEYSASRIGHDVRTEQQRLRVLERATDPDTVRVLSSLGIEQDWRCLELGAGNGSVARWLAGQCAQVTATDIDTGFLLEQPVPGVHPRVHDVTTGDFPAATFDLIHARFLLEHLTGRDAVLAKAVNWLAPGGQLVVEDFAVLPSFYSSSPVVSQLMSATERYLADSVGTDFRWAPRLPSLLADNGLLDIGVVVTVHVCDGGPWSDVLRATFTQVGPGIISAGLLTGEDFAAAIDLLHGTSYLGMFAATISAWGRRPPRPETPRQ
jgi:SAM-dependent methyltransferase